MRRPVLALALLLVACGKPKSTSLSEARRGFATKLVRREAVAQPPPAPPGHLFRRVQYPSPAGSMAAYLSVAPADGKKHPAIVWITGGDCNSIDDGVWKEYLPENDQSASAFRTAGIVTMFPALRGGSGNPGVKEAFLGEVDDVLAAADFLAQQPSVDATRLYLGGHSTGGTLALLTAEVSGRFRATFAFGPVRDVRGYGPEHTPFDPTDAREVELRAPGRWLASARSPVFVIEGVNSPGNFDALRTMRTASNNPNLRFLAVEGADHFSILAPTTKLLATKILADQGETTSITITDDEASAPFVR
jgi:acetyl esterase/lipase